MRHIGTRVLLVALLALLLGAGGARAVALPGLALPEGTHPGKLSTHNPSTLVGLGDSVTAGSHCDCPGYVADLAGILADTNGVPVRNYNLGQDGQTSGGLLASLAGDQPNVRPVARADLVVMTIGANDFSSKMAPIENGTCGPDLACTDSTLQEMQRNVTSIIDRIRALRSDRQVTIEITGYWNVFEDGAVADNDYSPQLRTGSDVLTRNVNAALSKVCAEQHVIYVDLYGPFKGDGDADDTHLLADDGDHPNAAGHAIIAQELAGAL